MERYLTALGMTNGEERAYMALLKLGTSSTGPIAKEAKLSRSKLYEVLEKLSTKGFVSHYKRNNVKQFTAAPPERIVAFLKEKQVDLAQQEQIMVKTLPLFEKLLDRQESQQEAKVFEGTEGIKNVRETYLSKMKPGESIYYFGNPSSGHNYLLGYWDDFNKRRVQKKIHSYIIYNQDAVEFGERRKKLPYTHVKYLSQPGPTPAWVEIYGDTLVIAMRHETPMSIIIPNKFVAESFKTYFNILWNVSKENV